jgi:hypothetical protein
VKKPPGWAAFWWYSRSIPGWTWIETAAVDGEGRISLDAFLYLRQGDNLVVGVGHGVMKLDALRDTLTGFVIMRIPNGSRFPEVDETACPLHGVDPLFEVVVGDDVWFLLLSRGSEVDARPDEGETHHDDDDGEQETVESVLEHGSSFVWSGVNKKYH